MGTLEFFLRGHTLLDIGFSVAICKKDRTVKRLRVLLAKEIAVCIVVLVMCSIVCILCNSLYASLNTNLCYDALCILCKYVQGGPIQNKICRTGRDMHDI